MNRIEDIAFAKTEKEKAAKSAALSEQLKLHPDERKELEIEMREALDNWGKRILAIKEQIELKLKLQEVAKGTFNKQRNR